LSDPVPTPFSLLSPSFAFLAGVFEFALFLGESD
jgi:hypothetical protein